MDKCIFPKEAAGELELLEMQEDQGLQIFDKSLKSINKFGKCVPATKYKNFKNAAYRLLSIFELTYDIESLFSTLKFLKFKFRPTS